MDDEVKDISKLYRLGLTYYRFHTTFLTANVLLLFLGVIFAPALWLTWAGTIIYGLALAHLSLAALSNGLRKIRMASSQHIKILSKAALLGPSATMLYFVGDWFLHDAEIFFHFWILPIAFLYTTIAVLLTISAYVYGICQEVSQISETLARVIRARIYSRQISVVISRASIVAVVLSLLHLIFTFADASPTERLVRLLVPTFFVLAWRRGQG